MYPTSILAISLFILTVWSKKDVGIFRRGLSKTRQSFFGRMTQILGGSDIEEETWEDLEAMMIQADMGVDTTQTVIEYLQEEVRSKGLNQYKTTRKIIKKFINGTG